MQLLTYTNTKAIKRLRYLYLNESGKYDQNIEWKNIYKTHEQKYTWISMYVAILIFSDYNWQLAVFANECHYLIRLM